MSGFLVWQNNSFIFVAIAIKVVIGGKKRSGIVILKATSQNMKVTANLKPNRNQGNAMSLYDATLLGLRSLPPVQRSCVNQKMFTFESV